MSQEFRQALLERWIDSGLTVDEMTKVANAAADIFEAGSQAKEANAAAAAAPAAGEILRWLTDRLGRTSDVAIQGGMQMASNVAPLALLGSVALPIAGGYYAGDLLSRATDPGKDRLDELRQRELIAELKTQTERLNQHNRAVEQSA